VLNKVPCHEDILHLIKHHATKTFGEMEAQLHAFLTSALDGGEWSASRPGRLIAGERAPGTHGIGGWVGLRAGLDEVAKRKNPCSCEETVHNLIAL
jgi:hypothetical protein